MKAKDLSTILTAALATATVTVATFLSDRIEGAGEADGPAPTIARPKLVLNGVEMALACADERVLKAGDQPVFELTASNTLDKPSDAAVCVTMSAASPADMMSRMIRMPSPLWQHEQLLTLKPNETRVVTLLTNTNLPAGRIISVSLRQAERMDKPAETLSPENVPAMQSQGGIQPGIVALSFSTVTAKTKSALASTQ